MHNYYTGAIAILKNYPSKSFTGWFIRNLYSLSGDCFIDFHSKYFISCLQPDKLRQHLQAMTGQAATKQLEIVGKSELIQHLEIT